MRKMYIQLYCIFLSFATTISISKKKKWSVNQASLTEVFEELSIFVIV